MDRAFKTDGPTEMSKDIEANGHQNNGPRRPKLKADGPIDKATSYGPGLKTVGPKKTRPKKPKKTMVREG